MTNMIAIKYTTEIIWEKKISLDDVTDESVIVLLITGDVHILIEISLIIWWSSNSKSRPESCVQ